MPFPSRSSAPCLRNNHDGSFVQFSSASNSCSSCSSLGYHAPTAPRDRQLRNRRSDSTPANCSNSSAWCSHAVPSSSPSGPAASVTESPIVRIAEHVATPPTAVAQLAVSNALGSAHATISDCSEPVALGMELGSILDGQITASSMSEDGDFTPTYSRLNRPGGFKPTSTVTQQWLEVDFKVVTTVSSINTQGWDGYWVTNFQMSYSNEENNFVKLKAVGGEDLVRHFILISTGKPSPFHSCTRDVIFKNIVII
ncbi:Hypothetical predicted protein [Paramuricea clavata]|uniref:Uncharacterized protein n=1 Tax=Paramuricea clavata TaxID=317549 RepID=A0A6S7HRY1_PARCT|nr:Hypothetical predicted protein [Paramuricea clavata]